MNTKITLNKAAGRMSEITGLSLRKAEDLLRGLADIITEELTEGETIKIKGLGTFKTIQVEARKSVNIASGEPNEIAEHTKVVFIPCKALASEVNSPFEFFETVELDDNVSEEELDAVEEEDCNVCLEKSEEDDKKLSDRASYESLEEDDQENFQSSESEIHTVENDVESETRVSESAPYGPAESIADDSVNSRTAGNSEILTNAQDTMDQPIDNHIGDQKVETADLSGCADKNLKGKKRFRFGWGFITGFAACLVAVAIGMGFAFAMMLGKLPWQQKTVTKAEDLVTEVLVINSEDNVVKTERLSGNQEVTSASVNTEVDETDIPTEASDSQNADKGDAKPVYDTITKTRYLTTMAKDHYGDFNLWPYIYEENKVFLGHPDRIKPGTKVVIPPLSKYGVKKTPEDIAKAKRLGAEIYGRYQ